jgi:hypothetical protein
MPDALRDKLIEIIEGGWTFNPDQWAASMERHANDEPFDPTKSFMNQEPIEAKYPMGEIFMQFDTDGDGVLNESEYACHAPPSSRPPRRSWHKPPAYWQRSKRLRVLTLSLPSRRVWPSQVQARDPRDRPREAHGRQGEPRRIHLQAD